MGSTITKDTSWVKYSFLTALGDQTGVKVSDTIGSASHSSSEFKYLRVRTGGFFKFMDTTLGGNTAINVPYQFTRYADPKERRLFPNVGKGMGEWYSKTIDDWGHNVHFQVGVPAYTSIAAYALRSIDGPTARYVATGRVPGFFDTIGQVAGMILSVAFWELSLLSLMISGFTQAVTTRFFYLKPAMFSFWEGVQTILNTVCANLGIVLAPTSKDAAIGQNPSSSSGGIDPTTVAHAKGALPAVFRTPVLGSGGALSDVGIEVHAVASRAQALQIRFEKQWHELQKDVGGNLSEIEIARYFEQAMTQAGINDKNNGQLRPLLKNATLKQYRDNFLKLYMYKPEVPQDTTGKTLNEVQSYSNKTDTLQSWFEQSADSADAMFKDQATKTTVWDTFFSEARDGAQWFSLRVADSTSSVSESFQNSSTSSEIGSAFNKISDMARTFWFNTAGMNTGISMLDQAIDQLGDFATGMVKGNANTEGVLQFASPIVGLLYGAKLESPKRWSESSASFTNSSFKLELRCGYGNVISYMQDILFPLCMCLQLVLPRGTGPQSYGSPFYVKYYSKGRSQVQVGLVSSMTVTRGVGNSPWSRYGLPMGVDIDFTIENMYDRMFSPAAQSLKLKDIFVNTMEENTMGEYAAVLAALGVNEQEYFRQNIQRRLGRVIREFDKWLSPHRWAAIAGNTVATTPVLNWFADQTSVRQ